VSKLKALLQKFDRYQQSHRSLAFTSAIIKKYVDDDGGRLAALITYYGFLSLFPLLLVATTATKLYLLESDFFQDSLSKTINEYFPVLGDYLQSNISGFNETGLALLVGLMVTIYGIRGGASAIRYALNQIWNVPKKDRLRFPASTANSLLIVLVGGGGLLTATVLSSYASALTDGSLLRFLPYLISFSVLICVFYLIFVLGTSSKEPSRRDLFVSALVAAIGVQILQIIGGYLLTHELKNLSNLYGAFAAVLGLFFWIYLQVQVLLFAAFSGVVHARRLWPRGLFG